MVRPLPHMRQRENALVYVRGLIEQGGRKSLQPTLFRLGESPARYESVQQFLADSPWDPGLLVRACAERVAPELGVLAWVVDDTGIAKDGRHSPGVKRQYSGTLGKIGNCQVAVSLHAVGERGTLPVGWALYLPAEWCSDRERRRQSQVAERLPAHDWRTIACRTTPTGEEIASRFAFVRVVATHPVRTDCLPPREEWLIIEWPLGDERPSDYWLSNLPANSSRQRLARLAR